MNKKEIEILLLSNSKDKKWIEKEIFELLECKNINNIKDIFNYYLKVFFKLQINPNKFKKFINNFIFIYKNEIDCR